jgi:hypothetical protein
MKKLLIFSVITDLREAEKVWRLLSPHIVVDDEWDFRYIFYKYHNYPLHFIVGYYNEVAVGLLPLQYNTEKKHVEFFGGVVMGDNKVFLAKGFSGYADMFFKQIIGRSSLIALSDSYTTMKMEPYEEKYCLDIKGLKNYEEYIEKYLTGKSKRQLRQQIRFLLENQTIEVVRNEYKDIELLFKINKKNFGKDSSFMAPFRAQEYRDLMNLYKAEMITIKVNGKKEAVSFGVTYKKRYRNMNTGTNKAINNLGKLLNLEKITTAVSAKAHILEAGRGSRGWKDQFKFTPIPQYQLILE